MPASVSILGHRKTEVKPVLTSERTGGTDNNSPSVSSAGSVVSRNLTFPPAWDIHAPVAQTSRGRSMSSEQRKESVGCLAYALGGASFIPLLGVLFGLIAIIWAVLNRQKTGWRVVVGLGAAGIALTVAIYSSLFYFGFVQRGGVYDDLRARSIREQLLPPIIKAIEYHDLQYGRYPDSLEELQDKTAEVLFVHDLFAFVQGTEQTTFYYDVFSSGERYTLFSSGPDGLPFTEDDVLPEISEEEMKTIGYRPRALR